ncbi:response regulator transcription factor [Paenibacillus sp. MMO-177]|uniref:response regulator transcription factor n=1 Tax=Paenibacillus sp. MMO-177 TaxID=3081289 RepID=UPI003017FAD7
MYRVLIVDDDRLARQGIISMMKWETYNMTVVGEAQNGEKAMQFLAQNPVDIVFVDISMPVMNGISFIEASKRLYPDLLYVVLTFHEEFHYVQTALRMGVIDYISKLQMESTDCNLLLKDISRKVDLYLKSDIGRDPIDVGSERSEPKLTDEEEWNRVIAEWRSMYWLYDDLAFERLSSRTIELNVPIWEAAQVLLHLVTVAEETICRVDKNVREYGNLRDFFEWIRSFRLALYRKAADESKFDRLPLCILKVIIYVKEHLDEKLYVDKLAQLVNLSRSYLSVNFKKYTGRALNEFIREERVAAAKRMLFDTEDLVSDIALKIGYEDTNYFIRVFHEVTGMTPGEFRKREAGGRSRSEK